MIKAVIFDMDGVLVDSEPWFHGEGQRLIFDVLKPGMTPEEAASLVGKNIDDIYRELTRDAVRMSHAEYRKRFDELAKKVYLEHAPLFPHIPEVIEQLRAAGYRIGLASSSPAGWISMFLERWKLRGLFDVVLSVYDIDAKPKPDPAVYLAVAQRLGLSSHECVGIEDSVSGLRSVKDAGMACIVFANGFGHKHDFSRADAIIPDLAQIPEIIRNQCRKDE